MDWLTVERFVSSGQAFIPINKENLGDMVKVIFEDGSTLVIDYQERTFLRHVLRFFGGELSSLRRRYGQVIGKKQLIPLPLSKRWTLIPFNCRIPIGRQSRTGWVLASSIQQISAKSTTVTAIHLGHHTLCVYHSQTFCLQQVRNARLVQTEFEQIHHYPDLCLEPRQNYCCGQGHDLRRRREYLL